MTEVITYTILPCLAPLRPLQRAPWRSLIWVFLFIKSVLWDSDWVGKKHAHQGNSMTEVITYTILPCLAPLRPLQRAPWRSLIWVFLFIKSVLWDSDWVGKKHAHQGNSMTEVITYTILPCLAPLRPLQRALWSSLIWVFLFIKSVLWDSDWVGKKHAHQGNSMTEVITYTILPCLAPLRPLQRAPWRSLCWVPLEC